MGSNSKLEEEAMKLRATSIRMDKLKKEYKKLEDEIETLRQENKTAMDKITTLESRRTFLNESKKRNDKLSEELKSSKNKIASLELALRNKKTEILSLNETFKKEHDDLTNKYNKLEFQFEDNSQKHEREIALLNGTKKNLERENSNFQDQLMSERSKSFKLDRLQKDGELTITKLREESSNQKTLLQHLEEENKKLNSEIQSLKSPKIEKNEKVDASLVLPTSTANSGKPTEEQNDDKDDQKKIEFIKSIHCNVDEILQKVLKFSGTKNDKEYLHFNELFQRNMIQLDGIDSNDKEIIKTSRKNAMLFIQQCVKDLESRVVV